MTKNFLTENVIKGFFKSMKSDFDKKYKTPSALEKALLYLKYQLRTLYWRILDLTKFRANVLNIDSSMDNFEINDSLKKFWRENGYVILRSEYSSDTIDLINEEISKSRKHLESLGQGRKDRFGRTGRIVNIHSINRNIFKFILDQRVRKFLQYALKGEPVLWGSLTFDCGTEQAAHADAPYFYTEPIGSLASAWTALEDVHPDAGPVFYYKKSHLHPLKVKDVIDKHSDIKQLVLEARAGKSNMRSKVYRDLAVKVSDAYSKELISYWENSKAEKKTFLLKKGDTLIWHQWLVHGGFLVKNQEKTRKSIIRHYCSIDSKHWPMQNFFLDYERISNIPCQKLPIRSCQDGFYLRQYNTSIMDWK